jgi:O-antigen ligase
MKGTQPRVIAYLVFLATIPLGEIQVLPGCPWLTITKLTFFCLLAVLAHAFCRKGWRPPPPPPAIYLSIGVLTFAACLAAALSAKPADSIPHVVRLAGACLLYLITRSLASEPEFAGKTLRTLVCIAIVLSLLGIYQTLTGKTISGLGEYGYFGRLIEVFYTTRHGEVSIVRASATFDHPNIFGTFLIGVLPSCLLLGRPRGKIVPAVLVGTAVATCLVALAYTFSRSAWLGGLVGAILVAAVSPALRLRIALLFVISLAAAMLLLPGFRTAILKRSVGAESYDTGRINSWHTASRMIADRPLLGVGPGRFHDAYSEFADPKEVYRQNPRHHMDAHNTYLDLAAEGGILTLLPFCLLLFGVVRNGWRHWHRIQRAKPPDNTNQAAELAIFAGCAAILVQSMFQSLQYEEIWWILLALAAMFHEEEKEPQIDEDGRR